MILRLAGATALMLAIAGPAFAVGPTCGDQGNSGGGTSPVAPSAPTPSR